jgi:hypothetical protein
MEVVAGVEVRDEEVGVIGIGERGFEVSDGYDAG